MRGAKELPNVVQLRPATAAAAALRAVSVRASVRRLRPRWITGQLRAEFDRVATLLGGVGRLEERFVDVIEQYARLAIRLRALDNAIDALDSTTYTTTGRHGPQVKTHPFVHLRSDVFRQWRALARELGFSPKSERGMRAVAGADLSADAEQHFEV
jgi:P27 family predicted phage terminase small subunit